MNYELEISKSLPAVVNTLNGGRPPLVAGAGSSSLLTSATTLAFSGWNKGAEQVPFSLEIWHLPITNTGELIVIGHITEGLYWNGSEYILRVIYNDDSTLEGRWSPVEIKARHLVVVYDVGSFTLYADGTPVITLETLRGTPFKSTSAININSGTGTGQYDSAALYYRALTRKEIADHYAWGRAVVPARDIAAANGGTTWTLSALDENVYETVVYDETNWNVGNSQNVSYIKNVVADSGAGGTWQVALPVNTSNAAALGGIALSYTGQGVTMSYSTDGVAWTAVSNRSVIMQGAVADGSTLFLQFVLADGDAWLNSVTVEILANRELPAHSGQRVLTFKSAHMDNDPVNQLEFAQYAGAKVTNDGHLEIQPDSSPTPPTTGTVEMWVKIDPLGGYRTLLDSNGWMATSNGNLAWGALDAVYVDGVARVHNTLKIDDSLWHHIVGVISVPNSNLMYVGRNNAANNFTNPTVGHLAVYTRKMTSAEAIGLYQQNVGAAILRIDDTSQITLSEEAGGPKFFANNWSYVSGGS